MQPRSLALFVVPLLIAALAAHTSAMPARGLLMSHGGGCAAKKDETACEADSKCKWTGSKCYSPRAPPVQEKPAEEKREKACEADSCANGGVCSVNPRGNPPIICNCTGTGYCGMRCGKAVAECQRMQQGKAEMAQSMEQAGRAGRDLERMKDKCTDAAKKMLCPPAAGPNARTCVEALADCFMTNGAYNATLAARFKKAGEDKCPSTDQKYCAQEDVCIGRGASCAPQTKCPSAKSYRCPSWKCASDAASCDDGVKPEACPSGQMRCPDGLCYAGQGGFKECAKKGVSWEGCPPGKMECSNGKPGTCAADLAKCNAKVGCVAPKLACGFNRSATTGKPYFSDDGKPKVLCMDACDAGRERPPKREKKEFDPSQGGKLEAKTEDGKPAMALKIGKGGFRTNVIGKKVNFTVDSVPDSLVQEGAFGAYFESGALLSSLVRIDPGEDVEVQGMMELDIPILDAAATTDPAICQKVLDQSVMLSISDITNVTDTVDPTSVTCSKGEIGSCSCAINVTHFSTYGVVDKVVAYEERMLVNSASPVPAPPPTTNASLSNVAALSAPGSSYCLGVAMSTLLAARMIQL
jgi:hypothetical protein